MEKQNAAQAADFDPDAFLVVPARTFEDLRIGEVFRAPSRTLTDAHAVAFQTVSADNHPVHYDAAWARRHPHSAPVVHGFQVLAFTAPGATLFPHFIGEVFISFLELSCTFLAEVYSGDTLYPALTITGPEPQGDNGIVVRRPPSTTSAGNSCCRDSTSICSGASRLRPSSRAAPTRAAPPCSKYRGGLCHATAGSPRTPTAI